MTKRERVIAALARRAADRGPTRLLMHNFATENSARRPAAETLRLARTFDWVSAKRVSRSWYATSAKFARNRSRHGHVRSDDNG